MKRHVALQGFSLLEVLIAISLLSIIATFTIPHWRKLIPAYALNSAARQIQSELHNLKMRAVAESAGFQLAYLQNAGEYTIQRDSNPVQTKPIPSGATITKAGAISFSPRGTAGANRVRLRDANGACRQVVVSATGRVRICTPTLCTEDC